MKSFMSVCAALLVFFASAPLAQAADPYVGLSAGVSILNSSDAKTPIGTLDNVLEYETGYGVNGALGIDGGMYRIEGAVGYQANSVETAWGMPASDDEEVSVLSFMANGYLDLGMVGAMVEPYVMAGIGVANVSATDNIGTDDSDTVLAYQFGGGLAFNATPNVAVDLGYRYFLAGDVTFDDIDPDVDYTVSGHNIMGGVRVGF